MKKLLTALPADNKHFRALITRVIRRRPDRFVIAFIAVAMLATAFGWTRGRAAANNFRWPAALTGIFASPNARTLSPPAPADPGAALDFDGSDDYVQRASQLVVGTTDFTMEAWINPVNGAGFSSIIAQDINGNAASQFQMALGNNHLEFILDNEADNNSVAFFSTSAIPDNTWTHVAVVRSGVHHYIYVNGVLDGSATSASVIDNQSGSDSSKPFRIGARGTDSAQDPFAGHIDDVRIWSVARTCDEIPQLKDCELTGSEANLVSYYKFDQGSAGEDNTGVTTATDSGPAAQNGTLNNFALTGSTSNWITPGGVESGISCPAVVAPIDVSGGAGPTSIPDGSNSPNATDGTDFGTVNLGSSVSHPFTIANTGTGTLTLTGTPFVQIVGSSDFTVNPQPSSPVAATNGTTNFTIIYTPSSAVPVTATVHILNDHCDEGDYDFAIQGTGIAPDVSVAVSPSSVVEDLAPNLDYTFTRTGDFTNPLTVNFVVSGTADSATDYTLMSTTDLATFNAPTGTVTIAAGNASATVTIDPAVDTTYEANETAVVTVSTGSGYTVAADPNNSATGTITNDDGPPAGPLVVNVTDDDDFGACLPDPGHCSLREAINAANLNSDTNEIDFNIPAGDPGHYYYQDDNGGGGLNGFLGSSSSLGSTSETDDLNIEGIDPDWAHSWWSIQPTENLPPITYPVTINGYSQPGAAENTDPTRQDGILRIELNGVNIDPGIGLEIQAGGTTVKGLAINHFVDTSSEGSGIGIKLTTLGPNTITGNFIGTDISGTLAGDEDGTLFGNQVGVLIDDVPNNIIGGPIDDTVSGSAAARNLISANFDDGVQIQGVNATGNKIQGNFIGTDKSGTEIEDEYGDEFGNWVGIEIYDGSNNIVGNSELAGLAVAGAGNVISGNGSIGIEISSGTTTEPYGNGVGSNFIGTDLTGLAVLGNSGDGVQLCQYSHNNLVGGTTTDFRNVIANNGGNGVNVLASALTGNTIRLNSIYNNELLGIDLNSDGVTLNDSGDSDPLEGTAPNNLQNFPDIASASISGGMITVSGNLNSTPGQGTTFKIDIYANSTCNDSSPNDYGEGKTYLGSVMADGDGTPFTLGPTTMPVGAGQIITATATDANGNTSEFSECVGPLLSVAKSAASPPLSEGQNSTYTITVTNSGNGNAFSATVKEAIPGGLDLISATGPNWSCVPSSGSDLGTITCTFSGETIASAGGTSMIAIVVRPITGTASSVVTNYYSIDPTGGANAPDPGTCADNPTSGCGAPVGPDTITVPTNSDLSLTKTDSPDPVTVGNALTYTLVVSNAGPDAATSVVVTDVLPGSVTFVSASPAPPCSHSAGTVTCSGLAGIAPGDSDTVTIVVIPNSPGSITNNASVSASNDPNATAGEPKRVSENTQVNAAVCIPPPANMVSWWDGSGIAPTANDIYGTNTGTLQNGATFAAGKVGQAFNFDGVDDYVSIPNVVNGWDEGTLDAWVNFKDPTPKDSGNYIFGAGTNAGGTNLGIHAAAGNDLRFGIYNGGWNWAGSGVVPNAGQWYHVAATWGSAGIKIYIDGVEMGSNAYNGPSYNSSYNMIGAAVISTSGSVITTSGVNAFVDEFEVFNRALSDSEIQGIYNAGSAGKCHNLPPTLTYNGPQAVAFNGSLTINPATGPSDDGTVSSIVVQPSVTYTGTISVDNVTGVVSISSAAPVGPHTITIRATDNNGATTDASFQLFVGKANQSITVGTHAPANAAFNSSFTVAATSDSGLTVSYSSAGACTNVGAVFTMTASTGTCTVKYDQAGNGNYNAATQVTEPVNAQKANQTITFGVLANKTFGDPDFSVSASASSGLGVSFAATGQCTVTGATVHLTGAGSCTITASQGGDSNYNAATDVPRSFSIAKANQTITVGTHAPASAAFNTSFTVAATSGSGLAVSYSSAGACTNVGATFTMTASTGTCTVKYDQAGDGNYNAATQVTESVTAQKADQTITFGVLANKTFGDPDFTVSAAASSGLGVSFAATGQCTVTGATVHLTGAGSCTITASQSGNGNYNAATDVPQTFSIAAAQGGIISFSAAGVSVNEDAGSAQITVNLTNSNAAATVRYATSDTAGLQSCTVVNGKASERCDYETTVGTLRFAAGETSKSFIIPIINDVHVEGDETFTVTLSAPTGASLGSPSTATVTIVDNDFGGAVNPIDGVDFFVTQQYLDILGRLPDATGFANWVATLGPCPSNGFGEFANPGCDRVHVAAGFYQSEEFQGRGYFAYRFYEVGLDRRPLYTEFVPDMAQVGGAQSPESEVLSKATYIDEFVLRTEFKNRYDSLSNSSYVNALEQNAEITLSNKQALIDALNGGTKTRAQVLRDVVETQAVFDKFLNRGFVAMQYFGYLRRDPDTIGYQNWVNTLDADPSNFRHMTFGFIYSDEYRHRFGP